jgi:subtilase family serine protease
LALAVPATTATAASANAPVGRGDRHRGAAVCANPSGPGTASCHARLVVPAGGASPKVSTSPYGLSPAQIKGAYGWTTMGTGSGKTIAIVDAFDDATAESDLAKFDTQYGLAACTTANGCFKKVDQTGGKRYPRRDSGWALEISLDVQWAHAVAPGAKILLVEAASNSFANLFAAEDYATSHAPYVSNSWGGSEFSSETSSTYDGHFNKAASIFVAAGDAGTPAEYPSSSRYVISVGGTTLSFNADGSLASETGWSSGGGGCSLYETAATAQSSFSGYAQAGCAGKRATPDVALDADPVSGVSVYDSTPYQGQAGWWQVGGTSAATPMWAARSAVAGATVNATYVYGSAIGYRDVTVGNNGAPCLVGFDLCSGRGSWTGSTP